MANEIKFSDVVERVRIAEYVMVRHWFCCGEYCRFEKGVKFYR